MSTHFVSAIIYVVLFKSRFLWHQTSSFIFLVDRMLNVSRLTPGEQYLSCMCNKGSDFASISTKFRLYCGPVATI